MKTKKIFFTIICAIFSFVSFGQNKTIDVLYLKNGSVIRGTVMEHIPFKTIKILTADGSIFVYKTAECDSIKKEVSQSNMIVENESFINDEKEKKKADSIRREAARIRKEAAKIRRNTVPEKFSQKCYYASILELSTFLGQSKYDDVYYIENKELIAITGFHTINGVKFLKNYFFGIGTGINIHLKDEIIEPDFVFSLPFFLDFRYYLLNKNTQPLVNISGGIILPASFIGGINNRYYYFVNPSLGVKAIISPRNSINVSVGYLFSFNKVILQTYNIGNAPHYDYMDHEVYNQINGINLKIGFTF